MADKTINLNIKTAADTSGVDRVDKAVKELEPTAKRTGRETVEAFTAMSDKAKISEFAFYDLDAAMKKTKSSADTFTAGATEVKRSSTDASRSLLLFSQGFEDAQYGIRGVLNNIPGLVMALGGTAGIAGAISIAAVSFSVLYEWMGKTEVKASDLAETIDAIGQNASADEGDKFTAMEEDMQLALETAQALTTQYAETMRAEQAYTLSALDGAAKIREIQQNIAAALGEQVDKHAQLIAQADEEAAKRKAAAENAMANERERSKAAQDEATKQADLLRNAREKKDQDAARLVLLRSQLETLREQEAELKKMAKEPSFLSMSMDNFRQGQSMGSSAKNFIGASNQATKAGERLNSMDFQASLVSQEKRVEKLEDLIATLGRTEERAQNALVTAQNKAADVNRAVDLNLQNLEESLSQDDALAKTQTVLKQQQQSAQDLNAVIAKFDGTDAASQAAIETIKTKTADLQVTTDELPQVAEAMQTLVGRTQAGMSGFQGNIQELIASQGMLAETNRVQAAEIRKIKETLRRIQDRK